MGPTTPIQANQVKKGTHVLLKGRPCKVTDVSISKTGKHGHAKAHFVGTDIFTDKRYEDIVPSTHNMEQPVLERKAYDLLDIEEGYMTLMDEGGKTRQDLSVPETDMGKDVAAMFEEGVDLNITILSWGDEYTIISWKRIE